MSLQAIPRRRVAFPPPILSAKINGVPVAPPYLWRNLSPEAQRSPLPLPKISTWTISQEREG
jgi:hypothetical protein